MIKITKHILLVIILLSPTSSSDVTYEGPSKITVNENFKELIALPPGYLGVPTAINNFVHQGTNFFVHPKFLLGGQITPPIGAIIASINPDYDKITGSLVEENIKVPTGGNKILLVGVTEDSHKPNEVTITGKYDPPPTTVEMNNIVPVAPIVQEYTEEVIEPHDIITISKEVQPVLRPELIITRELLTIPEAPVLPPLVIPELPVKVTVEESIPLSIELPSESETELHIPINQSNIPLLIESNQYRPLITEIDYKPNEIPTAPELPLLLLNKFPQLIPTSKNKSIVFIPTSPHVSSIFVPNYPSVVKPVDIPPPAVNAHNIVEERVIPNMFKINEKTTTKKVEILPFPISYNTPVRTSIVT